MTWTTEKPTAPGWYWFRELDGSDVRVVNVYEYDYSGRHEYTLAASGENFDLDRLDGHQWAGPLEVPQ